VVGAGGVTRGRPDAAVSFLDELLRREILVQSVTPLASDPMVEEFRERLRQSIGERLGENRVVVVVPPFEGVDKRLQSVSGGDRKGADVVAWNVAGCGGRRGGRDEIRKAPVGFAIRFGGLLAEEMEAGADAGTGGVLIDEDVVAFPGGWKKAVDAPRLEELLSRPSVRGAVGRRRKVCALPRRVWGG
jgi:hypothetical protein